MPPLFWINVDCGWYVACGMWKSGASNYLVVLGIELLNIQVLENDDRERGWKKHSIYPLGLMKL